MSDVIRLDKYLWAVRIFKTRSDAADAIRQNRVLVNESYAKPSREVKVGDMISVRRERVHYSYKVLDQGIVSSSSEEYKIERTYSKKTFEQVPSSARSAQISMSIE